MHNVNIYIQTTARGPKIRKSAHYIYVVECITESGCPATRTGMGSLEYVTENQIELTGLTEAFLRLKKPCSVRVFTQCEHILNSMHNYWPYQWQKNGWIKAAGKPVKNAGLWQQLLKAMEPHAVTFTGEENSFTAWQRSELKKMEAENGKKI